MVASKNKEAATKNAVQIVNFLGGGEYRVSKEKHVSVKIAKCLDLNSPSLGNLFPDWGETIYHVATPSNC